MPHVAENAPEGHCARVAMPYLARDPVYTTEKPFAAVFDVSGIPGAKPHNHVIELFQQDVHDARHFPPFNLDENGFEFIKWPSSLNPSNCDDSDFVYANFRVEMEAALRSRFPWYKRLLYLDHQVRKRSTLFPGSPGARVSHAQPAALPHSDFTTQGAFIRMAEQFSDEMYQGKDFDMLNIWTVIKGPNNDWPLAVCDFKSLDVASDFVANDVIYEGNVGENGLVHYNSRHKWYYLADQDVDDLIVFRNTDSLNKRSFALHAAFNPGTIDAPPRESMEIRFAGFY